MKSGHLAHALFPGGIDISAITSSSAEGVEETSRRLAQGERYLYEACFLFEETLVIVDLLIRTETGFQAFEVKSSLRVSDTYIKDACLQYYVVKNCLPATRGLFFGDFKSRLPPKRRTGREKTISQAQHSPTGGRAHSLFRASVGKGPTSIKS
jgi:hypothetical protein